MDISFNSGISSVSRFESDVANKDFPTQKSALKLSGKQVVAHVYQALKMHESLNNLEKKSATSVNSSSLSLSPEEHHSMTVKALDFFSSNKNKAPEFQKAYDVIQESKNLQEMLITSRNVLVAG